MQLLKEFREFAVKGNVIDLAVGVIIGAAFGKIVTSLVDDLVMPLVGMIIGRVDFATLKLLLGRDAKGAPITLDYGDFLAVLLQFLIVAWAVFLMVKAINKAKARFEPAPETDEPVVKECPLCLSEVPVKAIRCKFCTADLTPGV